MKTLLMILMIVFTAPVHAQETNHCHYPESWEQWEELIKNTHIPWTFKCCLWFGLGFEKRLKRDIGSLQTS